MGELSRCELQWNRRQKQLTNLQNILGGRSVVVENPESRGELVSSILVLQLTIRILAQLAGLEHLITPTTMAMTPPEELRKKVGQVCTKKNSHHGNLSSMLTT